MARGEQNNSEKQPFNFDKALDEYFEEQPLAEGVTIPKMNLAELKRLYHDEEFNIELVKLSELLLNFLHSPVLVDRFGDSHKLRRVFRDKLLEQNIKNYGEKNALALKAAYEDNNPFRYNNLSLILLHATLLMKYLNAYGYKKQGLEVADIHKNLKDELTGEGESGHVRYNELDKTKDKLKVVHKFQKACVRMLNIMQGFLEE